MYFLLSGSTIIEESLQGWGERDSEKKLSSNEDLGTLYSRKIAPISTCCRKVLRRHHQLGDHPTSCQLCLYAFTCPPHGRVGAGGDQPNVLGGDSTSYITSLITIFLFPIHIYACPLIPMVFCLTPTLLMPTPSLIHVTIPSVHQLSDWLLSCVIATSLRSLFTKSHLASTYFSMNFHYN